MIADRELWVTADGKAVEAGDPRGDFMIIAEGAAVDNARLGQFGVKQEDDGTLTYEGYNPPSDENAPDDEEDENEFDSLPDDFPGRDALIANGTTTLTSVKELTDEDLKQVKGIGEATIAKIRASFSADGEYLGQAAS